VKIASTLRDGHDASARVDSAKFFTDETALWAKVIKDINIEVQ
jgi:hypothetical protein